MTVRFLRNMLVVLVATGTSAAVAYGQDADSTAVAPDSTVFALDTGPTGPTGPFVLVGAAYAERRDTCPLCSGIDNDDNLTAHLRFGRYMTAGLGVGLDVSVWRRSRTDVVSGGVTSEAPEQLTTLLGNLSVSFTYRYSVLYVHAGGGVAYGRQDVYDASVTPSEEEGISAVRSASGIGVGYSVGGGVGLPMMGPLALTAFANWNVGRYDLQAAGFTMASDVEHRFLEIGLGLGFN